MALAFRQGTHTTVEEAEKSLKAIDRVLADVQLRMDQEIMAGKENSLQDFVSNVKAADTAEQKASPELGVEGWRFYSRNRSRSICNLLAVCLQANCQVLQAMTDDRERTTPAMALPVQKRSAQCKLSPRAFGIAAL